MTSGPEEESRLLFLDACCLLNLFATRHIEEILRTLQKRFAIAAAVAAEAMWIYRGGAGEDALERDAVDSRPLVVAGLLELLTLETDAENEDFVRAHYLAARRRRVKSRLRSTPPCAARIARNPASSWALNNTAITALKQAQALDL